MQNGQVYEDEAEHSNPPGLQMYHSECGGMQGETAGFLQLMLAYSC